MIQRSNKGFTLVEVMLAVAILAFALCSILATYVSCFVLIATSKNINIATNAALGVVEEIRSHRDPCRDEGTISFTEIANNNNNCTGFYPGYNGLNFILNEIPSSRGVVYVDDTDPDFLNVTVSVCWRQGGRIIGEDRDLDGRLDTGEDQSPFNGIIDSPVELVTQIANR